MTDHSSRVRRAFAALVGLLVGFLAVFAAVAAPASAAPASSAPRAAGDVIDPNTAEESIAVWIRQTSDKAGIPGVGVTVIGDDFDQTFTTDAEGRVYVGLPGPGTYSVEVDEATIPAASGTLPDAASPREVRVAQTNKNVPANFLASTTAGGGAAAPAPDETGGSTPAPSNTDEATGAAPPSATTGGTGFWGVVATKLATGLIFGLLLALAAIGASLIFGTTGLNNFAHGELVTFGGLMAYTLASFGAPGWLGILGAIVLGGLFGLVQDTAIWRPLRRRRVGLIPLMIVSIGLALATRYVYVLFYGGDRLTLPNNPAPFLVLGPISLRFTDVFGAVIAIVVLLGVAYVMLRTKLGKAARAVADNAPLAAASGINVDRVIRFVWIGAGALAGLSGVLIAYYQALRWDTGSAILLLIFAAVTLGGLGSAFGALVGSLVLSVFMNLATLVLPENLKYAAALVVLILILLFRPQGILGRKERVG
ncbi:branched-chain amino acid ABC transporter permease [Naasia sp. SYSU D00057]|uniref:branched-chain amino acid ABC transporter permease n=1 Tax=Naasia sp. SYSU D00057 TaxID=2817380 RepID=UPI0027DDAB22|nr:branched-chain amino acid ABC transporter permease [Naasia sp. SYSU D00057]